MYAYEQSVLKRLQNGTIPPMVKEDGKMVPKSTFWRNELKKQNDSWTEELCENFWKAYGLDYKSCTDIDVNEQEGKEARLATIALFKQIVDVRDYTFETFKELNEELKRTVDNWGTQYE